jgi:ribonuclease BN (tRNA processing enzyme)
MKITVIGAGNAFSEENFNQSFLVQEGDRTMLIDCGYQVPGRCG